METILSFFSSIFSILTAFISPWSLLLIALAFLAGCWYTNYMMKRNPEKYLRQVAFVNGLGNAAEDLIAKIKGKKAAEAAAKDAPKT